MNSHQNRVVEEKRELDGRISKLVAFFDSEIFKSLEFAERNRMTRQCEVMQAYSGILGERIEQF